MYVYLCSVQEWRNKPSCQLITSQISQCHLPFTAQIPRQSPPLAYLLKIILHISLLSSGLIIPGDCQPKIVFNHIQAGPYMNLLSINLLSINLLLFCLYFFFLFLFFFSVCVVESVPPSPSLSPLKKGG